MKEEIYNILLKNNAPMSAAEISEKGQISDRTYVSKNLAILMDEGRVQSEREGKYIRYRVSDVMVGMEMNLNLRKVHEDEVWEKLRENERFIGGMTKKVENILYFSFTEMLNNAIDHSKSGVGYVKVWLEDGKYNFVVKDKGVGVFRNFMVKKGMDDEVDAARELMKGKQTTMPKWHSGEGIFWTSKLADVFVLDSYGLRMTINNEMDDYAIEKVQGEERVVGTEVRFQIDAETEKSLQKTFEKYALEKEKYSFTTTEIQVKLYEEGEVWISRSQAKKITAGLERYKKVIFDFSGIKLVGQGFADEIFRVFRKNNPEIILEPVNMNKSVELMVGRALADEI